MDIMKKFGSHYAIERFGVLFLSLVICMGLLISNITKKQIALNNMSLSGRAVYTSAFTMSKTKTVGSVSGLYTNRDHTKVLILLHFTDMSKMPTKASDYSLRIAACDTKQRYQEIESRPNGMIYVFGSSGYMAIYLQDLNGFPSQLLMMMLESHSNLVVSEATSDGYYYDTGTMFFNPGGTYATHADFLEEPVWTFFEMIEEVMTRNRETSIRQTLLKDLQKMAELRVLMDEYSQRLTALDVVVPPQPSYVADSIYAVPIGDVGKDPDEQTKLYYTTTFGGGWLPETGSGGYKNEQVMLYLDAQYVVPGGFDFTWQNGRVYTGYLESLAGSSEVVRWQDYVNTRKASNSSPVGSFDSDMELLQWGMVDGSVFKYQRGGLKGSYTSKDKEINDSIDLLIGAWKDYYDLKTVYETDHLVELLQLEIDAHTILDQYTLNRDADVLSIF